MPAGKPWQGQQGGEGQRVQARHRCGAAQLGRDDHADAGKRMAARDRQQGQQLDGEQQHRRQHEHGQRPVGRQALYRRFERVQRRKLRHQTHRARAGRPQPFLDQQENGGQVDQRREQPAPETVVFSHPAPKHIALMIRQKSPRARRCGPAGGATIDR